MTVRNNTTASSGRLILRAELRCAGQTTVSYAVDLTPSSAFVAVSLDVEIDSVVDLRLSFPRLLEPVDLRARVSAHVAPSGPGAPSGLQLAFEPDARLTSLLERAASLPVNLPTCRVLFVEDNNFIRDVFEFGLRSYFGARDAHLVDHADTVAVAWQRLSETDYDLVIVDYYLPTANGDVLIDQARRDARFAGLPIVAVSVGGRDAHDATIAAGADLFLDKPLAFRDLFSTLRVLTHGNAPSGSEASL